MTILELFNSVDIFLLADFLKATHKKYYKKKKKTLKALNYFYNEINNLELIPLEKEYEDFLILCTPVFDDWDCNFNSEEDFKEHKLGTSFDVYGIHLNELKEKEEYLKLSWKENFEKNIIFKPTYYGIEIEKREKILNYQVSQTCINLFGKYLVAAELFWELTFYGLSSIQVDEEREKLEESCNEAKKYIDRNKITENKDETNETDENLEEIFKISKISISDEEIKESRKIAYKISEINWKYESKIFKEILEQELRKY